MTTIATTIRDYVESTRLIDTHEHLPDESTRLSFKQTSSARNWGWANWNTIIDNKVDDWSFLFSHYLCDDMRSAGIKENVIARFWSEEGSAEVKYDWISQHWESVRHTGYGQALRYTLGILYGESELTRESAPRIAEKYIDLRRPGFYTRILRDIARIDQCHVNSVEAEIFHVTNQPDLLQQDIDLTQLTDPTHSIRLAWESGRGLTTLEDWLNEIDQIFKDHSRRASAVKLKTAYQRSLHFAPCDRNRAERAFNSCKNAFSSIPEHSETLHNYLVRYAIQRATESNLPIKFHTGYQAGNDYMPLTQVKNNQSELCRLYQDFPEARFVIFHIGYPYHHETVAIAKHYHNVFVDMCFAWLLDPAESIQFLRSFVTAVPYNKLFAFGGDYFVVEPVAGHAHLARLGIARAITCLVEDGLLALHETPTLIHALMRGNALAAFGDPVTKAKCPTDTIISS